MMIEFLAGVLGRVAALAARAAEHLALLRRSARRRSAPEHDGVTVGAELR